MQGLYRQPFAVDDALHVHQTRTVCPRDIFGARRHVVADLVAPHADRDLLLLHGEHAAETAALVHARRLEKLDPFDQRQQVAQLGTIGNVQLAGRTQPHQPHAVTRVMDTHLVVERGVEPFGTHHVVHELADFVDARRQTRPAVGVRHQAGIPFAHETHAAGRRPHHIVVPREELLHAFGQRLRVAFVTRIGHRLPAAGLFERIVDVEPQRPQQPVGGLAHLRIEGVDVTRYE